MFLKLFTTDTLPAQFQNRRKSKPRVKREAVSGGGRGVAVPHGRQAKTKFTYEASAGPCRAASRVVSPSRTALSEYVPVRAADSRGR